MKLSARRWWIPSLAALLCTGCVTQMLTEGIVEAPNRRETPSILKEAHADFRAKTQATYSKSFLVDVGPPAAQIAVAIVEPGDYRMSHSIATKSTGVGRGYAYPKTDWSLPAVPISPVKGTILVLHGFQDSKEDMIAWALYLAQIGYRVVLVDLRGHGQSTGAFISYGVFETRDLKQVLDAVEQRGIAHPPYGLLGLSYGASVGLQLAGHDPRIASVVALEPFAEPRHAVVDFARGVIPGLVKNWTQADFDRAEDKAAAQAHFSWSDADVLGSVARTRAPIFYVNSLDDHWVPSSNTDQLSAASASYHCVGHVSFDPANGIEVHLLLSWVLDPIAPKVAQWFNDSLTGGVSAGVRLAKDGFEPGKASK